MKILHVIANPKPASESVSKQVTMAFFDALRKRPDIRVAKVDLNRDQPPFYSYEVYRHFWYPVFNPEYKRSAAEKKAAVYALRHGRKFNEADVIVLTTPMWNFAAPAVLKAWMDQVLSPGLTFKIGPAGVEPLHQIRKVVVLVSSGGAYEPDDKRNNLIPQIKSAFGFVGIKDVEVAWADGQNTFFYKDSAQRKEKAMQLVKSLAQKIMSM